MTNTGKLLIIGLLVIDAGVAGYLLLPKDDERAPTASGVVVGSIDDAAQDARGGSARVAGGSVMPELPAKPEVPAAPAQPVAPTAADKLAVAPPTALPQVGAQSGGLPPPSAQSFADSVPQQPVQPPQGSVPQQPVQPAIGSVLQQPATGSVALSSLAAAVPAPQQPAPRAANPIAPAPSAAATTTVTALAPTPGVAPDSSQVATGRIGDATPPAAQPRSRAQSVTQQKAQQKPGPRIDKTQPHRYAAAPRPTGSNPVAALLTDQLVRESSRPDPSLPMPSGVTVPSVATQPPPGRNSNPVAAAMTEQLVKESSKVAPIQQPRVPQPPPVPEPPILKH